MTVRVEVQRRHKQQTEVSRGQRAGYRKQRMCAKQL